MAWKFNPFTGALSYYEPGDEPGPHTHVEDDITDLSHLAIGELSTNAYRGDRGKTAYDHSQAAHADADADNTAANETSHADVLVDGDVGVSVAAQGHNHDGTYSASGHDHEGTYEPADDDIQTHITSEHAPSDADNTAANETSHADVLVDGDVGVSVAAQAHNHDGSYSATGHDHDEDYAPIGAATTSTKIDDFAAPDDNTDLNASTSAHGLCPKGDNNTSNFLRGDMTWAEPAGGGSYTAELCVLTQTSSASQNVGGANGTEVWWEWDSQVRVDDNFTHSTSTNPTRVTVTAAGWYRLRFLGNAQQTGGARSTLQGIYRINGGTTLLYGTIRDYSRGSGYGNFSPGIENVLELSASDYIEVGTKVEDTDATYTINSCDGTEVTSGESRFILELIP